MAELRWGYGDERAVGDAVPSIPQATAKDLFLRFVQEVDFERYTDEPGRAVVAVRCADLLHAVTTDSPGFEGIAEGPTARA
jgi:hypothetical protein